MKFLPTLGDDLVFLINISFSPVSVSASRRTTVGLTVDLFEQHQGTHILQVKREMEPKSPEKEANVTNLIKENRVKRVRGAPRR